MLSQAALVEWGPVLPRSTNHQVSNFVTFVYTWYIPNIYQVYANIKVYTMYIADIGIYLVYTWYILGIYQFNKIRYLVVGAAGEDRAPFHLCRLRRHLQAL